MKITLQQLKTLTTLNDYSTRNKEELDALLEFEQFTNTIVIKEIADFDKKNNTEKLSDEEYTELAKTAEIGVEIPNATLLSKILERGIDKEIELAKQEKDRLEQIDTQIQFFKNLISKLNEK